MNTLILGFTLLWLSLTPHVFTTPLNFTPQQLKNAEQLFINNPEQKKRSCYTRFRKLLGQGTRHIFKMSVGATLGTNNWHLIFEQPFIFGLAMLGAVTADQLLQRAIRHYNIDENIDIAIINDVFEWEEDRWKSFPKRIYTLLKQIKDNFEYKFHSELAWQEATELPRKDALELMYKIRGLIVAYQLQQEEDSYDNNVYIKIF